MACLIGVLMFFASSLRDDPLPATAVDAPIAETTTEFQQTNAKRLSTTNQNGKAVENEEIGEEECQNNLINRSETTEPLMKD